MKLTKFYFILLLIAPWQVLGQLNNEIASAEDLIYRDIVSARSQLEGLAVKMGDADQKIKDKYHLALAEMLSTNGEADSALRLINSPIFHPEKMESLAKSKYLRIRGFLHAINGSNTIGLLETRQALQYANASGDSLEIAWARNDLASVFYLNAQPDSSMHYAIQCKNLCDRHQWFAPYASSWDVYGAILITKGKSDEGIQLLKDHITRAASLGYNYFAGLSCLNFSYNVGNLSGRNSLDESLAWVERSKDFVLKSGSIDLLALYEAAQGDHIPPDSKKQEQSTLIHLHRALEIRNKLGATRNIIYSALSLGRYFRNNGVQDSSLFYYRYALEVSKAGEDLKMRRLITYFLSDAYEQQGLKDSALAYYRDYVNLTLAYEQNASKEEILAINGLYESELKESKLANLAIENDKNAAIARSRLNLALAIGAFSALCALLAIIFIRRRRRTIQQGYESDIAELEGQMLRSEIDPHYLSNMISRALNKIEKNNKQEASDYLVKMYRMFSRRLMNKGHNQTNSIEEESKLLLDYVHFENDGRAHPIDIRFTYKDVDPQQTRIPQMLLQPFVENAVKHAFPAEEQGQEITIEISKENDQAIRVSVQDNGVGIGQSAISNPERTSRGTSNTRRRITLHNQRHGLSDHFEYLPCPKGTLVKFNLPMLTH